MTSLVENYENFIDETNSWLSLRLKDFSWSIDDLEKTEQTIKCVHNENHVMPLKYYAKHQKKCFNKQQGYSEEELEKDVSSKFFYTKAPFVNTIELDEQTQRNIISQAGPLKTLPLTMKRTLVELTPKQRLFIYKEVIERSRVLKLNHEIQKQIDDSLLTFEQRREKEEEDKTEAELQLALRNLKRRRQSYKNTHNSSKKRYTEIIRDVLDNQMELLTNIWKENNALKKSKTSHK